MIDFLNELKTVGLTALFNPSVLFLLILLFFLGKLVGWMTRNINIWKFLALAYFGIFLFRPLQDAGVVIGGVFILGVASNYMDLFRGIFGWAGNLGDAVSALRYRGAYQDISRLEREIEELKRQLHASQVSGATSGASSQQNSWREQSKARKSNGTDDGQGRANGGTSRGSRSNGSNSKQSRRSSGSSSSKQRRGASGGQTAYKSQSRISDGPKKTGSSGGSSQRTTGKNRKASGSRPNQGAQQQKSSSQSQNGRASAGQQSQAGSQGQGFQQSTTGPSTTARDRHLQTLKLSPGQNYSPQELKAAWRKMAFKTHPDKGGSAAAFSAVQDAYKGLT